MTTPSVTSVDDIPAVCLENDLVNIFRLSTSTMRLWRTCPECLPFPPLPWLDRQIRVSGCVVAWFLAQEAGEYYRRFRSPLEELTKATRRNRPPWWTFAPPHAERYWAKPIDGENATLGVNDVAAILRARPTMVRRAVKVPNFPMPAAMPRPLRWTPGQVERLLWAPQDHNEHLQQTRRIRSRSHRSPR